MILLFLFITRHVIFCFALVHPYILRAILPLFILVIFDAVIHTLVILATSNVFLVPPLLDVALLLFFLILIICIYKVFHVVLIRIVLVTRLTVFVFGLRFLFIVVIVVLIAIAVFWMLFVDLLRIVCVAPVYFLRHPRGLPIRYRRLICWRLIILAFLVPIIDVVVLLLRILLTIVLLVIIIFSTLMMVIHAIPVLLFIVCLDVGT